MGQDTFVPLDTSQVVTHGLVLDHVEYRKPSTPEEIEALKSWEDFGCIPSDLAHVTYPKESARDRIERSTRATAYAAFTLSFIAVMIVVIWPFINSIIIGHNYNLMVAMNHTLQHDHKEASHLSPDVRAMQDYLVAQVFEPCTSAKCETDRITQMFGGKLPRRYQHYLLDAVAYQQQQQFEQESD